MKTIAQQYCETRLLVSRAKPRSERRVLLTRRLVDLMTRQLRIENRSSHRVPEVSGTRGRD